jgi:hypothetical protein
MMFHVAVTARGIKAESRLALAEVKERLLGAAVRAWERCLARPNVLFVPRIS